MISVIINLILVSACSNGNESKSAITRTKNTIISPYLEKQIDLRNNIIYCASFQIAWNVMRDQIIKGDVILDNDNFYAKQLNRQLLGKNDISIGSYVAVAGELSKDLAAQISNELTEKFSSLATRDFNIPQSTSSARQLIAYAFLYKNLEFPFEFEKLDEPITFVSNRLESHVKGFGISSFSSSKRQHEKLSNQVAVLDYKNENDFILSLTSKSDDDQIVLAKVEPNKTLLQTYINVMHRLDKNEATLLRNNEILKIPIIDFDLNHNFIELENKKITNKGWEGWSISQAIQDIRFKLDEKGAVLRSSAFLAMKEEAAPQIDKPRKFIFDKPFLICLRQKTGNYPYFALWINNSELFLKK